MKTYPARVGVDKAPEDAVVHDLVHAAAAIQEDGKHSFPLFNDMSIFFRFGGLRSVVGHGMFLGNGGDDQGGVQVHQGIPQGRELGVPTGDFHFLCLVQRLLSFVLLS